MKYNFINKGKIPSPAEIKSTMSFGKMVASSKAMAGVKLTSAVLKGTAAVKTAVISTVSVVAVATTTYVTYPEIFSSSKDEQSKPVMEEQIVSPVIDTVSTIDVMQSDKSSSQPVKVVKPVSKPPVQKPVVKKSTPPPLLINEDVVVQAYPLPSRENFMSHINSQLKYPIQHLTDSIYGFVKVRFRVNKKGETDDFKISKSLGEAFDNEAIRVIRSYKLWQPASYNGEAVDSYMHLTINFQIK